MRSAVEPKRRYAVHDCTLPGNWPTAEPPVTLAMRLIELLDPEYECSIFRNVGIYLPVDVSRYPKGIDL